MSYHIFRGGQLLQVCRSDAELQDFEQKYKQEYGTLDGIRIEIWRK